MSSPLLLRRLRAAVAEVRDQSRRLMFSFACESDDTRAGEYWTAWRAMRAELDELERALAVCELAAQPGASRADELVASIVAVQSLRGPR